VTFRLKVLKGLALNGRNSVMLPSNTLPS